MTDKLKEHTPGPWEAREIAHEATPFGPRRVYRVEIGHPMIDPISKRRYGTRRVCEIIDFASFTHDPANVSLITSAPDMLAELKRLFELYGHQATADIIKKAERR